MSAARRVFDARPRDRADAFDIAAGLWPRASASALQSVVALAISWMAQPEPAPEVAVIVTKIGAGRLVSDEPLATLKVNPAVNPAAEPDADQMGTAGARSAPKPDQAVTEG